ncbi:hypothetical protein CA13_54110 [Planctomycetes bacterium CA13]|uniref:Uncharacterized protein n=1 Tax=Novipirellula herctigrandis TaxID=2527986 RepID=A0A5C5ZA10_9BACT|nr:hypothetical protein CA13_54110 [Planctomycetes bacterium CA13]
MKIDGVIEKNKKIISDALNILNTFLADSMPLMAIKRNTVPITENPPKHRPKPPDRTVQQGNRGR